MLTDAHTRIKKFQTNEPNELSFGLTYINIGMSFLMRLEKNSKLLAQYDFPEADELII